MKKRNQINQTNQTHQSKVLSAFVSRNQSAIL